MEYNAYYVDLPFLTVPGALIVLVLPVQPDTIYSTKPYVNRAVISRLDAALALMLEFVLPASLLTLLIAEITHANVLIRTARSVDKNSAQNALLDSTLR
jgi:hypothetical protein